MKIMTFKDSVHMILKTEWTRTDEDTSYGYKTIFFINYVGELDNLIYNDNEFYVPIPPDVYIISRDKHLTVREIS